MSRSKQNCAAVILAAGFSSRMHEFKPLLDIAGETPVEKLAACFANAGIENIYVVTGYRADLVAAKISGTDCRIVHNPDYENGMYTSVYAGLQAAFADGADACFMTPVDCPLIASSAVTSLLDAYKLADVDVFYPQFAGKRGHPPLISKRVFENLPKQAPEGGLGGILQNGKYVSMDVRVTDPGILYDMDTFEDYVGLVMAAEEKDIPDAATCRAFLNKHMPDEQVRRHCTGVACLAMEFAGNLQQAGVRVNEKLVYAAAILHDICRLESMHADKGALMLAEKIWPRVAAAVLVHMDISAWTAFSGNDLDEAQLVYLADKMTSGAEYIALEGRLAAFEDTCMQGGDAIVSARMRMQAAGLIRDKFIRITGQLPEDNFPLARACIESSESGEDKQLFLARHAQTELGEKRYIGVTDVPLSDIGYMQAMMLAKRFEDSGIEAVYVSGLQRSLETGRVVAEHIGIPLVQIDSLHEIDMGIWDGLSFDYVKEHYQAAFEARGKSPMDFAPPEGETMLEAGMRLMSVMDGISEKTCKKALIVAHAGINRALITMITQGSWENVFTIPQSFICVNTIVENHGKLGVVGINE